MKKRSGIAPLIAIGGILLALSVGSFFLTPDRAFSENENRYLQLTPRLTWDRVMSGDFMEDVEDYTSDQIVFRDFWTAARSVLQRAEGKEDISGTYLGADGRYFAKVTDDSFDWVRLEKNAGYIRDFFAASGKPCTALIVPSPAGILRDMLPENAPYFNEDKAFGQLGDILGSTLLDSRETLSAVDDPYYHTDHHWTTMGAQAAYTLWAQATGHTARSYDLTLATDSFRGTLYSKVLLPDSVYDSVYYAPEITVESVVCDGEDGALYDLSALEQKDKYELFLGGNYGQCVITTGTENGKHLLLVKDSFANSFVPFLTGDYETITMIDLRYYRGSMAELAAEVDDILVLTEVTNLAGWGDFFKRCKSNQACAARTPVLSPLQTAVFWYNSKAKEIYRHKERRYMAVIEYDEYKQKLQALEPTLGELEKALGIPKAREELAELQKETEQEGFWNDLERSQQVSRQVKRLENKIKKHDKLVSEWEDTLTLCEMAQEEDDPSQLEEVVSGYETLEKEISERRLAALLSGEYDANNAILTFHAGAGGTEAQDWTEMLYRMYTRWAERHGYTYQLMDYEAGDEAGIKSATILIEGENAYGYLKSENGVHRLVRVSPFDANARRQTSFAALEVMPELDDDSEIEIRPEDIEMQACRSSGAGGQHINKTSSAVRLTHLPTGIVVFCQTERSQFQNRDNAMKMLRAKLAELKLQQHAEKISDLKGVQMKIEWGSQIRSYVFMPYTLAKDTRTGYEMGNIQAVMDGDIDGFINAYLTAAANGEIKK